MSAAADIVQAVRSLRDYLGSPTYLSGSQGQAVSLTFAAAFLNYAGYATEAHLRDLRIAREQHPSQQSRATAQRLLNELLWEYGDLIA